MGRDLSTWAAVAAAWAAKRRREESGAVDLGDMATSPEAVMAAALVSAVMPTRRVALDNLDFWGAGHGTPAGGLDLGACQDVGRAARLDRWSASDRQQARMLRAVARWRSDGGAPEAEPVWTRALSPTLRCYANGCSSWDLLRVEDDARPGPELAGRLAEYRQRGTELAQAHPDMGDVQAGPPPRQSLVGLPSWRHEAPADDAPDAPAPPAPSGGAKP